MEGLTTPELVAKIKPYEDAGWRFDIISANQERTLWRAIANKNLTNGAVIVRPLGNNVAATKEGIIDLMIKLIEESKC